MIHSFSFCEHRNTNTERLKEKEMEAGYKHFSHVHNLIRHEMPEGAEISCSGSNSSGTGTVYVCWQCSFFLHKQCFRAARSLKHPSHPSHPLTLLPYPTYPSNSFYCNSCRNIGTGFSYSCSDCEFDLHVQCAYSISIATTHHLVHPHAYHYPQPNQTHAHQPLSHYNPNQAFLSCQTSYAAQNAASASVPISNLTNSPQNVISVSGNPAASAQYPSLAQNAASVSAPTSNPNPVTSAQNVAYVYAPTSAPDNLPAKFEESDKNGMKNQEIKHFSHPHGLRVVNNKDGDDPIACSACEEPLAGKGYSCVKKRCDFHLHESCFHLEKEIRHESHPNHPLALLATAPYGNENGEYTCNACFSNGTGFTYHCTICKYDLHPQCVALPKTVKREDHDHVLKLLYFVPLKGDEYMFSCDVCHGIVQKDHWIYYCEACDFGTHLGCVGCEECAESSMNPVLEAQLELQRLQIRMQMARKTAEMIASAGASMASLIT